MVDRLRAQGITDERVLDAMAAVPRERFVPSELADGVLVRQCRGGGSTRRAS